MSVPWTVQDLEQCAERRAMPQRNPAYPPEFRREAVRLVRASDEEHPILRRSSPERILLVYSPERHDQLAGTRAANRERRVTAVGIPFSQLAIRPTLTAAAVAS